MVEFNKDSFLTPGEREDLASGPREPSVGRAIELFVIIASNPVQSDQALGVGVNFLRRVPQGDRHRVVLSLGDIAELVLAINKRIESDNSINTESNAGDSVVPAIVELSGETEQLFEAEGKINISHELGDLEIHQPIGKVQRNFLNKLGVVLKGVHITVDDAKFLADFVVSKLGTVDPRARSIEKTMELFHYYFQNMTAMYIVDLLGYEINSSAVSQAFGTTKERIQEKFSPEKIDELFQRDYAKYREVKRIPDYAIPQASAVVNIPTRPAPRHPSSTKQQSLYT